MKKPTRQDDSYKSTTGRIGTLEVGRGMAASAVVLHHASLSSDAFSNSNYSYLFDWGIYGVDFFFVLSGFIIYHIHQNDPRDLECARRFMLKRIRRIYIPYLPISIILIAAYIFLPGLSNSDREWGWYTSLTLLPSSQPPALSVAWTLTFEVIFYAFFLFFYVTRFFWLIIAIWVTTVLLIFWLSLRDISPIPTLEILLSPLILEFVAGMAAAHLYSRMPPHLWYFPLTVGLGGIVQVSLSPDLHRAFLGMALAPVVLGLAQLERRYVLKIPQGWLLLGASSYAIYLIHNPLQSIVARLLQGHDNWVITFIACTISGVVVGIAYHLIYERPILRYFSSRKRQSVA